MQLSWFEWFGQMRITVRHLLSPGGKQEQRHGPHASLDLLGQFQAARASDPPPPQGKTTQQVALDAFKAAICNGRVTIFACSSVKVDVLTMPDGALLVSDEDNGAIYRITYRR